MAMESDSWCADPTTFWTGEGLVHGTLTRWLSIHSHIRILAGPRTLTCTGVSLMQNYRLIIIECAEPSAENRKLSKVFFFKPEIRQNIALNALPTARSSAFLVSAFPVHSTLFSPVLSTRFMDSEWDFYLYFDKLFRSDVTLAVDWLFVTIHLCKPFTY